MKEGITNIDWTVYGKINRITKSDGTVISYTYDASGNRISKTVGGNTDWYVRDAGGNVVSVYTVGDNNVNSGHLTQSEVHLYGSSRLGLWKPGIDVTVTPNNTITLAGGTTGYTYNFIRWSKFFELNNHLGSAMVVVSDRKLQHTSDNTTVDYYLPDVVSANDYYPGGMLQPGRTYNSGSYAYGFGGKRKDNDIKGGGNAYDFGARIYDPRAVVWYSTDMHPKTYLSPYTFARGNPVNLIDPDGNTEYHFHYLTVYEPRAAAGADGSLHMTNVPVTYRWVNIIEDNLKNTFYVHRDVAKADGKFSPVAPLQFFPDADAGATRRTGITSTSYFLINRPDDDYTSLLKILDGFPELKGIVAPTSVGLANNTAKTPYQKNLDFRHGVYQNKAARSSAEKEQEAVNALMIGIATTVASELLVARLAGGGMWLGGSGTALGEDAATLKSFNNLSPKKGWFDVVVHGDDYYVGSAFSINGKTTSVADVYKIMLENGYQQGTKIRLISCNAGKGAAQELANLANAQVIAPTSRTLVDAAGKLVTEDASKYKIFNPISQ